MKNDVNIENKDDNEAKELNEKLNHLIEKTKTESDALKKILEGLENINKNKSKNKEITKKK